MSDVGGGAVADWRAVRMLAAAVASRPRLDAVLEAALPEVDLRRVGDAIGLELSDETVARIRGFAAAALQDLDEAEPLELLRRGRAVARRVAARELAHVASVEGAARAAKLADVAALRDHDLLNMPAIWQQLVGEHWTTLPLFGPHHFRSFFTGALRRPRSRLARAVDALVGVGPSAGGAGGAEATAVIVATTAPNAE